MNATFPFRKILLIFIIVAIGTVATAQELYTAKGYWEELNQKLYQEILNKKTKGDSLSTDQKNYLQDYQAYLDNYYQRMSEEEKLTFARMEEQWSKENSQAVIPPQEDFNLRARDRVVNGLYGLYYGASIASILEIESGASVGIPLVMAGLWQLGPVINPKKYEDITVETVRAGNTGKILGLVYGGAAGLAISGDSDNNYKWVLGLSSVGSIAMGEIMFQNQKKKHHSLGYIDIVRYHGFLGPIVTTVGYLSIDENPYIIGASALAGGIGGMIIGNSVAKKYDYTQGDADVISSLTWITTGLGAAVAAESINEDTNRGLILIPVATAIAGSVFGHRSVKGVYFTSRQGSTISLASGGAALVGLGAVAIAEADRLGWYFGVPSVCALVMHQVLYSSYKKKNLEQNFKMGQNNDHPVHFSMNVMPENYIMQKQITEKQFFSNPSLTYPLVSMKLVF